MESSLHDFLERRRVSKGESYTHTSLQNPKGCFNIAIEDISEFMKLLKYAKKHKKIYGLCEKPLKNSGPLRQDFDFRFNEEFANTNTIRRVYTRNNLGTIHSYYAKVIKSIVRPDCFTDDMVYCVVSEKSNPRMDGGKVKDGFHLFFPYFFCNQWINDNFIPKAVTRMMIEGGIFSEDVKNGMGPVENLIDDKVGKVVWMMYGSTKNENSESYEATHYLNEKSEDIEIEECFFKVFKRKMDNPYFHLPFLMSIRKQKILTKLKKEITKLELDEIDVMEKKSSTRIHRNFDISSEKEILEKLKKIDGDIMGMIGQWRSENWHEWINIGWTLHSISQGHEKGLDMWIDFSMRSKEDKFKIGECEKEWEGMDFTRIGKNGKTKTVGSIKGLAKIDNPREYDEYRKNILNHQIKTSLRDNKPSHVNVAKVLHAKYEDRFVCSNSKTSMWYEYKNHAWHKMDDGITIKKLLIEDITDEFRIYALEVNERYMKCMRDGDTTEAKNVMKEADKCHKYIDFLGQDGNLKSILNVAKSYFHKLNFHRLLDKNPWLIGDKNGVYDLKLGKHRDGVPDDLISKKMGCHYIDYTEEHPDVIQARDHINKVFVNKNIRSYWGKSTASCMRAGNVNKKCYIWTNDNGDNAKTVTLQIIENVFGEYFYTFDNNRFIKNTMKSAGGGSSPDLIRMDDRRIGAVKELAVNEPIDIGFFKKITGNDSMWARTHYDPDGRDITPVLTTIWMCNHPPKIPDSDRACWNRVRIIGFESTFNDDAPDSIEEQYRLKHFKADPLFKDKMIRLTSAFYWVLLQYFKQYQKEGLIDPKEVIFDTDRYQAENNIYIQFVREKVEQSEDDSDEVSLNELNEEFKEWYKENYPSYKFKIGKNNLLKKLQASNLLGEVGVNNRWSGFRIKISD